MIALDMVAPNYLRAKHRWPTAATLSKCQAALSAAYEGNSHGSVEHVKSFIECVCLTILAEFSRQPPSSSPSTTELLVAALRPLGLEQSKAAAKLGKVLSGFNKLADALTEMRNDSGPVAHGRDAFVDSLSSDHARAFIHAGDAILGLLLNALEGKEPDLNVTREPYDRFPHLNSQIDRAVSVTARVDDDGERSIIVFAVATGPQSEAIEIRAHPSRLLYGLDRAAYIEVLQAASVARRVEHSTEDGADSAKPLSLDQATAPSVTTGAVAHFRAWSTVDANELSRFIEKQPWSPTDAAMKRSLIRSVQIAAKRNMGIDWLQRDVLQARTKVAMMRALVANGVTHRDAGPIVTALLKWLHLHVSSK